MTDFSTRNPGLPPTRHKPSNMGAQAAARGAKAKAPGPQPSSSPRGGMTSPTRTAKGSGATPSAPQPKEQSDFKHAVVAAQYQNMRQLGRDIPFGVYLIRNGHYREIAPKPFDLFLDS